MLAKFMKNHVTVTDPPIANTLFNTTKFAWLWLIVRVFLGYQWINAGYHKLTSPEWMSTGNALKGFWSNALTGGASGQSPIAYGWYHTFLQFMFDHQAYTWFAKLVACGEFLIGVGLILGAFVGIAAFFGAFLNWNFLMAGTASINGMLFAIAIVLILAWKVAGWYGLDRFLLPMFGTPWAWSNAKAAKKPAINITA